MLKSSHKSCVEKHQYFHLPPGSPLPDTCKSHIYSSLGYAILGLFCAKVLFIYKYIKRYIYFCFLTYSPSSSNWNFCCQFNWMTEFISILSPWVPKHQSKGWSNRSNLLPAWYVPFQYLPSMGYPITLQHQLLHLFMQVSPNLLDNMWPQFRSMRMPLLGGGNFTKHNY